MASRVRVVVKGALMRCWDEEGVQEVFIVDFIFDPAHNNTPMTDVELLLAVTALCNMFV